MRQNKEINRFLRFTLVGISGTLIDFSLLAVFKEVFFLPTAIANTLSYSAGVVNNFILNRLWTFPDARGKHWTAQFWQFAAVNIIAVTLNSLLVTLLETPFDQLFKGSVAGYIPAKVVATLLVLLWNFYANRRWTFNE
jgi:putative flippase GtrA